MNRMSIAGAFAICLPGLLLAAPAPPKAKAPAKARKPAPEAKPAIITTDQVERGMKGYGLTVFQGTKIEKFSVEVIDVLKDATPRGDQILIRMSGGPLEKSGIVAGMSGSPVYFKERWAGAVAYGWRYAKEPIAGVTPADQMLEVLKPAPQFKPVKMARLNGGWYDGLTVPALRMARLMGLGRRSVIGDLAPVRAPLVLSGFSSSAVDRIAKWAMPLGLLPVAAGGARAKKGAGPPPEAKPGSALAVELIKGDVSGAVTGTITYRDGNRILGFGHPMFSTGVSRMPMAVGHVHTVLASRQWSFKLSSPLRPIGQLVADRLAGVAGTIGPVPKMVPCTVSVDGLFQSRYRFEVVDDRRWTARLFDDVLVQSIDATERTSGEAMVRVRMDVRLDKHPQPIVLENTFYANPIMPAWITASPLHQITRNQFEEARISKIDARVVVREGRQTADVVGVATESRFVRPGESVSLEISLRPFGKPAATKRTDLRIPKDARPGTMIAIDVCDASTSQSLDRSAAPDRYRARSLDQLIRIVREQESNTHLFVRTTLPKTGVTIEGEAHPELPPAMMSALAFSNTTGIAPLRETLVKRIPTEWVISGRQKLQLFVQEETVR